MYYLLVILLPLGMVVLFLVASLFTDLWATEAAPWLLACVVNNLILSTYVNWRIFVPLIERGRRTVQKELAEEYGKNAIKDVQELQAIEQPLISTEQ